MKAVVPGIASFMILHRQIKMLVFTASLVSHIFSYHSQLLVIKLLVYFAKLTEPKLLWDTSRGRNIYNGIPAVVHI